MSEQEEEETWETQEVIRWLGNDEDAYSELLGEDAETIEQYVARDLLAPAGLYESFAQPPVSSWDDVDWQAVADALQEEEEGN